MHAAEGRLLFVEGDVALHPLRMQTISRSFPLAPASGEKTAVVFQFFRIDDERPLQFGLAEDHCINNQQTVSGEL
jgi:hypothetical protein